LLILRSSSATSWQQSSFASGTAHHLHLVSPNKCRRQHYARSGPAQTIGLRGWLHWDQDKLGALGPHRVKPRVAASTSSPPTILHAVSCRHC
jgi:hypothetical protein